MAGDFSRQTRRGNSPAGSLRYIRSGLRILAALELARRGSLLRRRGVVHWSRLADDCGGLDGIDLREILSR